MKLYLKIGLVLLALVFMSLKGDKPAYKLFNNNGKAKNFKDLVKEAAQSDIVLFGELHNNPIAHWLQIELTNALYDQNNNLVLGAEMFESDNQLLLNELISGKISEKNFEREAKLWKNYKTDYKPLVKFAKENKLPFIATNIPRRYASLVHKKGFEALDSLSQSAKKLIAPLPVAYDPELEGYKAMLKEMEGMGAHASPNLPKAQAIKDATMAHNILKNWESGKLFLHYNGDYHSKNYEGIVWYLKQENPELKILTISTVEQDTIFNLDEDFINVADYIICIPASMTKTYSM
jgi:uncharacterized iron-regulated protein